MLTNASKQSSGLTSLLEHLGSWIDILDAVEWTAISLILAVIGIVIGLVFGWKRNRWLKRQTSAIEDQAEEIRKIRLNEEDRLIPKLEFSAARFCIGSRHRATDEKGSVFEGWEVVNNGFVNVLVSGFQLEKASSQSARKNRKSMPSLSPILRYEGTELTTLKTPRLLRPREQFYVYYPVEDLINSTAPDRNDGVQMYIRPECWDSDRNIYHPNYWSKWDDTNEVTYTDLPE